MYWHTVHAYSSLSNNVSFDYVLSEWLVCSDLKGAINPRKAKIPVSIVLSKTRYLLVGVSMLSCTSRTVCQIAGL